MNDGVVAKSLRTSPKMLKLEPLKRGTAKSRSRAQSKRNRTAVRTALEARYGRLIMQVISKAYQEKSLVRFPHYGGGLRAHLRGSYRTGSFPRGHKWYG